MYKLYDLALADRDVRPSPWCWLAKYALLHKGLEFETVTVGFADKSVYPDPDYGKVPVLADGERFITDSANIIAFLEKEHPEKPFLATSGERAAADFYMAWLGSTLFPPLASMMFVRVHALAHEDDKDYFRQTREARFGKTLEELAATPGIKEQAEAAMATLSAPLVRNKFLGGDQPNLSDYIVFAPFMWQRSVTSELPYELPQPAIAWQERMLDLFDGYGRNTKTMAA